MRLSTLIKKLEKAKEKYGDGNIYSIEHDVFAKTDTVSIKRIKVSLISTRLAGRNALEIKINGF